MVAVPSRGLGPFSGPVPGSPPSRLEARTPRSPGTRRSQYLSDTTSLLLPRGPRLPARAPNTRRATCGATAVPRGMSPPSDDFTGLAGTAARGQAGACAERRRLREGRRAPTPSPLGAGEEGSRSPAARGEPSQTSAPAPGLRRAQVAARKPEPGQRGQSLPERGGVRAGAAVPRGAVSSPGPCGTRLPRGGTTAARDGARSCARSCPPRATRCPTAPAPEVAAAAPFRARSSTRLAGRGCSHHGSRMHGATSPPPQ